MRYKSYRKAVERALVNDLRGLMAAMGSEISNSILMQQRSNIYRHAVPPKYKYIRSHDLAKYTGYIIKQRKGIVILFSTQVYAAYLEQLVGKRWETTFQETDLKVNLENMKMPKNRPYANFIPGFIKGMKKIQRRFRYIKWALS